MSRDTDSKFYRATWREEIAGWFGAVILFGFTVWLLRVLVYGFSATMGILLLVLLLLWIYRPQAGTADAWVTPQAAEVRSRYRPILATLLAMCGFVMGIMEPMQIESIPEKWQPLATAIVFAAGGAVFARFYRWLHPITMP